MAVYGTDAEYALYCSLETAHSVAKGSDDKEHFAQVATLS